MNNRLLVSTFIFLSSFVLAQEIAWQQTLGGAREEHLYDAISTYDYGILLAGSSVSEASGNKKDGSQTGSVTNGQGIQILQTHYFQFIIRTNARIRNKISHASQTRARKIYFIRLTDTKNKEIVRKFVVR